jgi:hypothetical protein
MENISLYIPHVFPNFNRKYIAGAFSRYGDVSRIDLVAKRDRDGKDYNAAYVHFNAWYDNPTNRDFQCNLLSEHPAESRIYHDSPWYWIVLPNNTQKHLPTDRKPRIDLGNNTKAISATLRTPEKQTKKAKIPGAPVKPAKKSYAQIANSNADAELDAYFDSLCNNYVPEDGEVANDADDIDAEMAEMDAAIEAEEKYLISIDGRYVQTLEQENMLFRQEIARLQMALMTVIQVKEDGQKTVSTSSKDKSE